MFLSTNIVRAALLVGSLLPAARSATFDVVVGGPNGLKYEPEFVNAAPGDMVRFIFQAKNHTATQSTFATPCAPAEGGFDTGFIEVDSELTEGFPVAELPITDTNPIWVYCKQGTHCSAGGMVFAVNPGDQFATFKANAVAGAPPAGSASSAAPSASATVSVPATPSSSSAASAPSPSTSAATTHTVLVGASGLTFEPSSLKANVGDKVIFEFRSKNHTVTQSSFASPCAPAGFDSGYQPVAAGSLNFPKYEITINNTQPVWMYCAQGQHCQSGMVFAVNPADSGERTFAAFQDLAKASSQGGNGGYGSTDAGSASSIRASFVGGALALIASALLF